MFKLIMSVDFTVLNLIDFGRDLVVVERFVSIMGWSSSIGKWSGYNWSSYMSDFVDKWFTADDCVETVVIISGVVNGSLVAISIDQ